ncbi:polysaccharide biosynthesis protein [Dysgonomonas sp. Marseille-P4677]|uniref:oligosaccharide flippase family protein n=1 Tax=Dysgonomonas sp. Marseille-P4677 TaxID=2364790 RepID=UPI0019125B30|nr:oligosaccharide flippase family protein [Dysgonomonas sp. Marseille-P4677]MBK5720164.1 polysaccharide biosynthesis protein [Dysgonomonas sp. Marseille-P4677]
MAGSGMKSLAKDTAIYGLSSIVGRLLNYCLVPLHVYIFTNPSEYGQVNYILGFTALFFVLLTYGMETSFFRFMNKQDENSDKVYSTSLISLGTTSLLFILFCFSFIGPISEWMQYTDHREHIMIMAIVVALDAFMVIPFAYLRYQKRPIRFATLKLAFIFFNILFNVLFLVVCPWLSKSYPDFILNKFYHQDIGIGYIFLANLISTLAVLIMLIPNTMKNLKFQFDPALLRRILKYSFPLLILGLAGVINQAVAQLTYPFLFDSKEEAFNQLGIYSACIKITVIITMFTQAFRYAYEPFFFSKNKNDGNTKAYADAMKFFIIFALLVFLGVMFYLDIIKYIISENYTVGIVIVPIAMMGEILFGVYFNLSVWYKLTDKTKYGAYFSILGCIIQVAMNIILVPIYGYIASAWATFICNLILVLISYSIGQKYFPIKYDVKNIFLYFILAIVFYITAMYPTIDNEVLRLGYRTLFLIAFTAIVIKRDLPLSEIPFINRYFKHKNAK